MDGVDLDSRRQLFYRFPDKIPKLPQGEVQPGNPHGALDDISSVGVEKRLLFFHTIAA